MRNVLATAVALAIAAVPALAVDGPGRALVASNTLQFSSDRLTVGSGMNNAFRTLVMPYSGTVRLKWDIRSHDGTQVFANARVNHVAENCRKNMAKNTFVTQTCDLQVVAGLPIFLDTSRQQNANSVDLKNVRLYYTVIDSTGRTITFEPPSGG